MSRDGEIMVNYFLSHAEYDPVKAREYYLRNRELKGRRSAVGARPVLRPNGVASVVQPKRTLKPVTTPAYYAV